MTAPGTTKCQPQTNDPMAKHEQFKRVRNTFLVYSEENEFIHTVSTHEERDGSSSCTQSTPFLSPSTVWGWGHWVDLGIWQLLLLHPLWVKSHFGWCGSEASRNRLPLLTKGQVFAPVCFCYFVATFLWVTFLQRLLWTIRLLLCFLEPLSLSFCPDIPLSWLCWALGTHYRNAAPASDATDWFMVVLYPVPLGLSEVFPTVQVIFLWMNRRVSSVQLVKFTCVDRISQFSFSAVKRRACLSGSTTYASQWHSQLFVG